MCREQFFSFTVLGFHFASGLGSYKPGIVALVKFGVNALRLNIGAWYFVFCWPLRSA